jgi:Carboxypeptidase regulatory-like domain
MSDCVAFCAKLGSLCVLCALALAAQEQAQGLIRGTVVDQQGKPIAAAMVNADPIDGVVRHTLVRYVETDQEGHFSIDRLQWGRYRVYAKQEDLAYPDMAFPVYDKDTLNEANITPDAPIALICIRLAREPGF